MKHNKLSIFTSIRLCDHINRTVIYNALCNFGLQSARSRRFWNYSQLNSRGDVT